MRFFFLVRYLLTSVYFHEIDTEKAIIALSDFTHSGWHMSKSRMNLSLDHIEAAVIALGNFHGEFYALKYSNRNDFDTLKSKFLHNPAVISPFMEWEIVNCIKRDMETFRILKYSYQSDVTEEFLNDLQTLITMNPLEFRKQFNRPIEPLATICHGDFLRNNIAFKYNENDLAVKAMLFDFQTITYSSPMFDLNLFLSLSVGYETRQKHLDDILRIYYSTLINKFIEQTNIKDDQLPVYLR